MRVGVADTDSDADRVGFGLVAQGAKLRPCGDFVLVLQDDYSDPDEVSKGGIHIGGLAIELPEEVAGEVLAVGPGKRTPDALWAATGLDREPIGLTPGDRVRWRRSFGIILERMPGDRRVKLLLKSDFIHGVEEN